MVLTAVPVGFVAGLFGIGGGLITVPFLYYIFGQFGINQQYIMHLAVGTSFAIIIPTSIVSVLTHHKFNSVDFNIVKNYGIFVIIGVIIGTIFAATFKTKSLVLFFSIVISFLGIYLLLIKEKDKNIISEMKLYLKIILGTIVGFISAITGIGGAVMNVPILKFFGYSINKAIGSAAAIGFLIALFGATGFFISGSYLKTNLPFSIPKGKVVDELSLRPICKDLELKLSQNIKLISKDVKEINSQDLFNNNDEKIVMLENIRFYPEEEKNNPQFAKYLATLADIYVNDAFSCSHRAHASIDQITNFLPSYSGLQFDLEVSALKKITSEIKKPITCK